MEDNFFDLFGITKTREIGKLNTYTLLDALQAKGGFFNQLARHSTAALLNTCNEEVNYPYTEDEILQAVQEVFENGNKFDARNLAITYDEANNLGCPLSNSNSNSNNDKVNLYPNPAQYNVTISADASTFKSEEVDIIIYNTRASDAKNQGKGT